MIYTAYYLLASGEIVAYNFFPEKIAALQITPQGCGVLILPGPYANFFALANFNFVSAGVLAAKTAMSLTVSKTSLTADGVDEAVISGIPSGGQVMVSGAVNVGPEIVTDGALIITSNTPGTINVTITKCPQNLDWSTTLNAT